MNLLNRIFNTNTIECPRCLGKGHVDWDDIKRLKRELKWLPGSCAYCDEKGTISSELQDKIAVDLTYLTIETLPEEKKRLINNNKEAIERSIDYESRTDSFISQIEFLHFQGNMEPYKIAEFYHLNTTVDPEDQIKLVDYIKRVIELKT